MQRVYKGLVCALLIGLTACQERAVSPIEWDRAGGKVLSFTEQSQSCNPYDWFGWFHNKAMNYGMTYQNDYLQVAPVTASYMVGDFLVDWNPADIYDTSQVYPIAASVDSIRLNITTYVAGKTRSQMIAGLPFSSASKASITQLLFHLDQAYDQPFLQKCDLLVLSVQNNPAIDSAEKVVLQTIIAVAYHSFQFWDYHIQDGGIQSFGVPGIAQTDEKKSNTKAVVESDIVGAVVGAGIGAAAGAISGAIFATTAAHILTGGVGDAPGAVIGAATGFFRGLVTGAIGGAIAGSVMEGIVKPMINDRGQGSDPKKKVRPVGP